MKRFLLIGGALLAVIVAGAVYFMSNIGALIKTAVETYGTEALQAKVTLASADVSIQSGQGQLKGLTIGNPKGFNTPAAMALGEIKVTLDAARTTKDVVAIKEILIMKPAVTYEMASAGSNFDALQKNAQAYARKMGVGGGARKEEKTGKGPKLIIDNLYIRDGRVGVSHALLKGKDMSAPLPNIHLKDIGKDKKGASPAEVADTIMAAVAKGTQSAVGTLNLDKVLGDAAGMAQGAVKGAAEGAAKALEGAAGAAGDTMKKLLGK